MNESNREFHEYSIDGCTVHYILQQVAVSTCAIIEVYNPTNQPRTVDLTNLPIKINDWYYYAPYMLWVEARRNRQIIVSDIALTPVDNLTFIEQLAEEKNLV